MWTEESLDGMLATPSSTLIEDAKQIEGDIIILGAGGKMGPTLSLLAKNAMEAAGNQGEVTAVSRFTDQMAVRLMKDNGIRTISTDLMDPGAVDGLPDAQNVIYMAGRKFGTNGLEALTWAMNAWLPSRVAERYKASNIVAFSSGNIYPLVPIHSGGATEIMSPSPTGEYGMSCLGRERMFEYGSATYGTPVFIYRLNYAVDLRYGVLYDIASKVAAGLPIDLSTPSFNCIWQGDANEIAIRALLYTGSPAVKMNVTGPETVSTRYVAEAMGVYLGRAPVFEGTESNDALLSNSALCIGRFGYPTVSLDSMLRWQAEWILAGGRALNKPTHFEERKGSY